MLCYIYIYAYIYIYIYIYMLYIYMFIIYIYVHYIYICILYIYIYIYIYMYIIYIYICILILYIYIYIYVHMFILTPVHQIPSMQTNSAARQLGNRHACLCGILTSLAKAQSIAVMVCETFLHEHAPISFLEGEVTLSKLEAVRPASASVPMSCAKVWRSSSLPQPASA